MPYTLLAHTADIRMRVSGETLQDLFRDALLGMVAIMQPGAFEKTDVQREITVEAPDATALLVDFLSDTLFWMYTEAEVYTAVDFKELSEHSLKCTLRGCTTGHFSEDIKAVTYHEADVRKDAHGRWVTNIIFDL